MFNQRMSVPLNCIVSSKYYITSADCVNRLYDSSWGKGNDASDAAVKRQEADIKTYVGQLRYYSYNIIRTHLLDDVIFFP